MEIQKLSTDDLKQVITEQEATSEQIQGALLESIAKSLKAEPIRYRLFGAYWWLIKRQLIEKDLALDENIDLPLYNKLKYDNPVFDIVAAWTYSGGQFEQHGLLAINEHAALDGEDLGTFVVDEFMETLIG